jgi:4-diphosphocytidyl-2-C-methyl-D-erythritol kinase
MSAHRALAPAKINLGLFVGPRRDGDARHELVSVMQSISLADELILRDAPAGAAGDEVHCPGLGGAAEDNLAAVALRAFRAATGWRAPPQRLSIDKRIPLAAGLGGGSADAAATLRLAQHASGLGDEQLLLALARELGADVPAQIAPGRWLARGAGELLEALPAPMAPLGVLVLPDSGGLSTAAVYAAADGLGSQRTHSQLDALTAALRAALAGGAPLAHDAELLENDLQNAAISLCPRIDGALEQARECGAQAALVSGSGPTVIGLFSRTDAVAGTAAADAELAASALAARRPAAIAATAVDAAYGAPLTL